MVREKENSYVYDRTLFLGGGVEECEQFRDERQYFLETPITLF